MHRWWRRGMCGSDSQRDIGAATATDRLMRRSSAPPWASRPRLQAGGSASFYHFRDAEGISENGFGSFSLYGKFLIADPLRAPNAIGVAVTPLLEFSPGSEAPVGWALPVNLEARRGDARIYGSARLFLARIGVRNGRRGYSRQLVGFPQRHVRAVIRARRHPPDIAGRRSVARPHGDERSVHRTGPDVHASSRRSRAACLSPAACRSSSRSRKTHKYNGYDQQVRAGTHLRFPPSN